MDGLQCCGSIGCLVHDALGGFEFLCVAWPGAWGANWSRNLTHLRSHRA